MTCLVTMLAALALSTRASAFVMKMAAATRRPENVAGSLYVDTSCINCDTCRWMAPAVFTAEGPMSAVTAQPSSPESQREAMRALVSCPTGSIRLEEDPKLLSMAKAVMKEDFPLPLTAYEYYGREGVGSSISGIYHLGYHSAKGFGAIPWLVVSESGSSIMVDSPRFSEALAKQIEAKIGGPGSSPKYMFLTHKDDVADHARWQKRFPTMTRCIHQLDHIGIDGSEIAVDWFLEPDNATGKWHDGLDSWELQGFPGATILHTPGHSCGSCCLLWQGDAGGVLFTGDHCGFSNSAGQLSGFPFYNNDSRSKQADNIRALTSLSFQYILPGHGRPTQFKTLEERNASMGKAADDLTS
ncbi:unnamed protein product [Chrysoparadoxa australica]